MNYGMRQEVRRMGGCGAYKYVSVNIILYKNLCEIVKYIFENYIAGGICEYNYYIPEFRSLYTICTKNAINSRLLLDSKLVNFLNLFLM